MTLMRGAEARCSACPACTASMSRCIGTSRTSWRTYPAARASCHGATDDQHAAAAHKVLATPDAHLVLAIGGDHLTDGIAAIQSALDSSVPRSIRRHPGETSRRRFGKRKPDVKAVENLIDEGTVMSGAEVGKVATIVSDSGAGSAVAKKVAKTLKTKAKAVTLSPMRSRPWTTCETSAARGHGAYPGSGYRFSETGYGLPSCRSLSR